MLSDPSSLDGHILYFHILNFDLRRIEKRDATVLWHVHHAKYMLINEKLCKMHHNYLAW